MLHMLQETARIGAALSRRMPQHRFRRVWPARVAALALVLTVCAAATVMTYASQARAEQPVNLVVVSAQGGSFAPGDVVPSDQPVTLTEGQALSLIAPSGRIVELKGPYADVPMPGASAHDADLMNSLKWLIRERMADTGDMGATRLARVELPDPWVLDVNTSGQRCLREGQRVVLWRADAALAEPVTLSTRSGAWKARATWPAGEPRLLAPPALPTAEGDRLTVAFSGGRAELSVTMLPDTLTTDAARLAWMLRVGCDDQAAALARRMP